MKKTTTHKLIAVLLTLIMTLGLLPVTASAATTLDTVTVTGVIAPAIGDHPTFTQSVPSGANYTISTDTTERWYNMTDKKWMTAEDTFEAGKRYEIGINFCPNSGYAFAELSDMTATIDGIESGYTTEINYAGGGTYPNRYVYFRFTALSATPDTFFDSVTVTGITAPAVGAHPAFDQSVPSGAKYTISSDTTQRWYNKTNGKWMTASDTFEAAKTYSITLVVTPNSGCSFAASSAMTAAIDGIESGFTTEILTGKGEAYRSRSVTYIFKALPGTSEDVISSVTVMGVTAPAIGDHPTFTQSVPSGANYTLSENTEERWYNMTDKKWMTAEDTFEAGKRYEIGINFCPNSGYAFVEPSDLTVTIDGIESGFTTEINYAGGGTYPNRYVYFRFTALSAPIIATLDTVTVTGVIAPAIGDHPTFTQSVPSGANYTISTDTTQRWRNETDNRWMTAEDTFETGKRYSLNIAFLPNSGYAFAGEDDITAKIDGIESGFSTVTYAAGGGTYPNRSVHYYFTALSATPVATKYNITVTDGSASDSTAEKDTVITITAASAPEGKEFDKWEVVSGGITLGDAASAITTFTMPANDVSVKATYKAHVHSGGTATCTAKANCEVCGAEYGDLAEHDYSVPNHDETQHWNECSVCHAPDTKSDHTGGTATCTAKANCEVCGAEYGDLAEHDFSVPQHNGTQHWNICASCGAIDTKFNHIGGSWLYDEINHWKNCRVVGCGTIISTKAAHSFGTDNICDICGYEKSEAPAPTLLEGNNGNFVKGGKSGLSFRSSAEFADFVSVSVDGTVIGSDKYAVISGSTIVTLKADYLDTLSVGSHTLTIASTTGSVTASFTIEAQPTTDVPSTPGTDEPSTPGTDAPSAPGTEQPTSPQTGDSINMLLGIALLLVAGIGVIAIAVLGKKRRYSR